MHARHSRLATIALLLVAVAFASSPVGAGAASSQPPSSRELARATEFREYAGLRADGAYVSASFVDRVSFSDDAFGVPLTPAEAGEMQRRGDVQTAIDPAFAFARSQRESAGTYIDQPAGGVPVFLVAGDPTAFRSLVAEVVPSGVAYRVETARHTLDELYATQGQIDASMADLRVAGINAQSTAIDIIHNSVLVGVEGNSPATSAVLIARYGDIVTTREEPTHQLDTCVSRDNCAPLKGGIKIYRTSNPAAYCTSGWIVHVNGTTTNRVLTAGHCIQLNGGLGIGWSHNGSQFGTAQTETWGAGANSDAGLMSVGTISGDDNLFYASSNTDVRSVTSWLTNINQNVGDQVCRSGATTGYRCGYVIHENVDRDVDGFTIHHQWEVAFDASPGDSGASMFFGNQAWGTHSDSALDSGPGPYYAWYSPMEWLFSALSTAGVSVSLCTTPTC